MGINLKGVRLVEEIQLEQQPVVQETKQQKIRFRDLILPKYGSDPWITLTSFLLMIFGTVMVVSTNMGVTVGSTMSLVSVLVKQIIFMALAWLAGMIFVSRMFNYRRARFWQVALLLFYLLALIATFVIGIDVNGSRAWIRIGSFLTIQPSEFGKPLLIMCLALSAGSIHILPEEKRKFSYVFRYPIIMICLSVIFVGGLQKDFGSLAITMIIGLVGILIPSYASLEKWQRGFAIFVGILFVLFVVGCYLTDAFVDLFGNVGLLRHIAVRIENMKNPYLDIHGDGYQPSNALYAIADGGLKGTGFGTSVRKYGFLTQAESDYILAIIIEELGIMGLSIVVVGYGIIFWRLIHWALRASKQEDKVLLCGVATYFFAHFIINVGGVSTLIPMTGVPLLLISAGGSALIAVNIALGMAQSRISAIRIATNDIHQRPIHLQKEKKQKKKRQKNKEVVAKR